MFSAFSKQVVVDGETWRLPLSFQQPKSLDNVEKRSQHVGGLTKSVSAFYGSLPSNRKRCNGSLRSGELLPQLPGLKAIQNPCSANPASFLQPVLDAIAGLAIHFNMSSVEINSAAAACLLIPNCTVFFADACPLMMAWNRSNFHPSNLAIAFGHTLGLLAKGRHFQARQNKRCPQFAKFNLCHWIVTQRKHVFITFVCHGTVGNLILTAKLHKSS